MSAPKPLDDWALMGFFLVVLVGSAFLSASSAEHLDVAGVVGFVLLVVGVGGAYWLGLRRGDPR